MIEYILYFILTVVMSLVSYSIGRYYRNKHPDGELHIINIGKERRWNLSYYGSPDELYDKKVVIFKVECSTDD